MLQEQCCSSSGLVPVCSLPLAPVQAAYLDFVTAIVLRKNSITGVLYRDDPTILAWDIANEPSNPGDETGDILQVGPSAKGYLDQPGSH